MVSPGLELTADHVLRRAAGLFHHKEVVSLESGRARHRYTYGAFAERVRRLVTVLRERFGIAAGQRVATLSWNHHEHLEAYFALPLMGASIHTVNARLHEDEAHYVLGDAEDVAVLSDATLAHLLPASIPKLLIGSDVDPKVSYEAALRQAAPAVELPTLHESMEMMVCHTSGTTGRPKGVAYTHRSTMLHTMGLCTVDALAISERDCVMPVVPMYHAAAWGLPYAAALVGSKMVLPGPSPTAEHLLDGISGERVTVAAAVPTVWIAVTEAIARHPGRWDLSSWKRVMIGGAATSESLIAAFEKLGIEAIHCWGMTETNPVAFRCRAPASMDGAPDAERRRVLTAQGYPLPFVEARHASDDAILPRDGVAQGELEVRGPWIVREYLRNADPEKFKPEGWFRTGDIVTIDEYGYARIRDRVKDVIKSGGEWISSLQLETLLMDHPDVVEAAVFAAEHPQWGERPLAAVVIREGTKTSTDELRDHLAKEVPKFWLPDDYVFVAAIPRTSTGKFDKRSLRETYGRHLLTSSSSGEK